MKWVSRAATGEAGRIIADAHQHYYDFPDVAKSFKELTTTISPAKSGERFKNNAAV